MSETSSAESKIESSNSSLTAELFSYLSSSNSSPSSSPIVILLIGVSGVGKSTIGLELSKELKLNYYEGDDFHSKENKSKMQNGIPLNDDDRLPWLKGIGEKIREVIQNKEGGIFSCSALKYKYRNIIRGKTSYEDNNNQNNNNSSSSSSSSSSSNTDLNILFFYLHVPKPELVRRLLNRKGHFMGVNLLESQLDTLDLMNKNNDFIENDLFFIDGKTSIHAITQNIILFLLLFYKNKLIQSEHLLK